MSLRWIGFGICAIVLLATWWLFSPKDLFERESAPKVSSALRLQPLTIFKGSTPEPKTQVRAVPPQPAAQPPAPALTSDMVQLKPLSNEEIEEVFSNHERQFQNCWIQRLKDNPDLKGTVTFRVTISPRGNISETQLASSDIDDTLMLQCLNSTLSRFSFREFRGDPIEVLLPLEFEF